MNQQEDSPATDINLFSGPGEMARLMRETDWDTTALGHPDLWPRSLRVAVRILLASGYPMYIAWGPRFVQLYNDAYRPILGKLKHPAALGSGTPQTFREIWDFIGPMFQRVMDKGQDTTLTSQALFMDRNGYLEECYYDFSYSPIPDDTLGKIGGVLVTCSEVTNALIEQRRLKTVRDLGSSGPQVNTAEAVCEAAARVFDQNQFDLPFAAIYLLDESAAVQLAAVSGAAPGDPVSPPTLPISNESAWPVESALADSALQRVPDLQSRFSHVPTGAWPDPPREAVLLPLTGASLRVIGFIVAGINPRKQFDDPMEQFMLRCAHALAGRLANARAYEDARRRADSLAELDRAKTVFFSNISHEFRTPLTLIASPLEDLAASTSLNADERECVELAQRNVLRLQRLVNNLLDFSRIEAGRVTAAFEPVDIHHLTADLASGFRSTFEKAGLYLQVNSHPIADTVYLDRDMWEKIVLNLLSNAFKFTFSGGVTIQLTDTPDTIDVQIADTGVGIPASELPHVFERFHRIESTHGRSYEGTGIGLALVQELVKIHGGVIAVESREGLGTRFTISLRKGATHLDDLQIHSPRSAPALATRVDGFVSEALRWIDTPATASLSLPPDDPLPGATAATLDTPRQRVLIVDDNADMRQYISRLLQPYFDVDTAAHGEQALQRIHASAPGLVLTDAMMPVMDGFSLLARLRASREFSSLPVILLSARAGDDMEIEGREAGADDYIVKPFSARELIARVRAALKIAEIRAAGDKAVRASENRAQEILQRTTDAVFVLDREWRFAYMNPNARALISNGRELIGKIVWEEFPDAVQSQFWVQYHRAVDEGITVEFQEYYPEPLDKWFEVHAYPTDQGLAVFFRDVSAKHRAEAALRQSEKLAAVGRLASSIAHEINNPLEAVTNLLYLMECDRTINTQTRKFLETAQSELSRVSHIATQTLRFYRQTTNPSPANITEVLDSVIALFKPRLPDHGVIIERLYRSDSIITAHEGELRQVFSNLIRNSLDAIGNHGRIVIRERIATSVTTGERGLRVTIADTGHGMDRATVKRLFEPFFSTKPSTGTGLGLWVSKEIIDKHCGSVTVHSSTHPAHHGTVFAVFLPNDGILKPIPTQPQDPAA